MPPRLAGWTSKWCTPKQNHPFDRHRSGSGPAGRFAPLMSPVAGLRPPSPPLLRCAKRPTSPLWKRHGCWSPPRRRHVPPRAAGGRRSEVEQEGRAKPVPGGMSSGGYPPPLARADIERTGDAQNSPSAPARMILSIASRTRMEFSRILPVILFGFGLASSQRTSQSRVITQIFL